MLSGGLQDLSSSSLNMESVLDKQEQNPWKPSGMMFTSFIMAKNTENTSFTELTKLGGPSTAKELSLNPPTELLTHSQLTDKTFTSKLSLVLLRV